MSHTDLARLALAAAPAAVPVSVPVWGPAVVEVFGANIPVASMILSLFGLAMARGVSNAREGKTPGGLYLTGTLVIITVGIIVERQPGPGMSAALGVGIGGSGILVYDMIRSKVRKAFGIKGDAKEDSRSVAAELERFDDAS